MKFERLLFLFSSVFLAFLLVFGWGFVTAKFQLFPYASIREVAQSLNALRQLYALEVATKRSAHEIASPARKGGVTTNELALDDSVNILTTLFHEGEFKAQMIDRQGTVVHEWKIPFDKEGLSEAKDTGISLSDKQLTIHGACVRDNGDLYIVIEFRGLLKLNRASELLWAIDLPIHHAVSCDPDGSVWTLSRRRVKDKSEWIPLVNHTYIEDQVLHVSADGEILDQFSLLDVIFDNQYEGILYGGHPGEPTISHDDPTHANDIDTLTREQASHFPLVKEGDLMISMRTISTVFIVDRRTREIRWSMTGPFIRQHDPEVSRDGLLLVYDNRTAKGQTGSGARHLTEPQALGYSRIVAIEPVSRNVVWQYQGSKETPFYSSIHGKHKELPNGNILVVEPEGGRIFEVDRSTREIVWEFVNLVEQGVVGRVTGVIPVTQEFVSDSSH